MINQKLIFTITTFFLAGMFGITACANSIPERVLRNETFESATATPHVPSLQDIQVNQGSVLPPYGLKVRADVASLNVRVHSSKDDMADRLADIQQVIDQITLLATDNETVRMGHISINQVGGDSERALSSAYSGTLDTSSVILSLNTDLLEGQQSLIESVTVFNDFLDTLTLAETVELETLSIETRVSTPEDYRAEIIANIYREVSRIKEEYGPSVTFEVTGVHRNLQIIPLSDVEYYLYIEPTIVATEF